jgi:MiaB/RimO family radical SAM methylthiotransferase
MRFIDTACLYAGGVTNGMIYSALKSLEHVGLLPLGRVVERDGYAPPPPPSIRRREPGTGAPSRIDVQLGALQASKPELARCTAGSGAAEGAQPMAAVMENPAPLAADPALGEARKKVYLYSTHHPCTENAMNLNLLKRFYTANHWEVTPDPSQADYVIVATCGFSQQEEDTELAILKKLGAKKKKGARLVVTGCLPMISQRRVAEVFDGDYVHVSDLSKFDDLMAFDYKTSDFDNNFVSAAEYDTDPEIHDFVKIRNRLERFSRLPLVRLPAPLYPVPTTAWFVIRVGMGCTENCSYCAIKHAHGFTKSEPMVSIMTQAERGLALGYRTICLSGESPGSWGVDIRSNIVVLLEALLGLHPDLKINLRYISPVWLIKLRKELKPLFATGRITHFCTPIQSGSNRVLERMNRPYTVEKVKETVNDIMQHTKVAMISTNMIVGFPGETEEDFNQSLKALREIDFGMYMVFRYSERTGTKAATLTGKLTADQIESRYAVMNRLKDRRHLKLALLGEHWLREL